MTRILVSTASKHGATHEIGDAIAAALEAKGIEAFTTHAADVTSLEGVDAVVIGSGVYAGRWLEPAKALIDRFQAELRLLPVWLFSSGPLDGAQKPDDVPLDAAAMIEMSGARAHRVFAGRLTPGDLGFAERAIVKLVKAPYGDFRDWAEISAWASEIAEAVVPADVAAASR
jgi:menaquinone-dependent protoporphyrinogen oxidase